MEGQKLAYSLQDQRYSKEQLPNGGSILYCHITGTIKVQIEFDKIAKQMYLNNERNRTSTE